MNFVVLMLGCWKNLTGEIQAVEAGRDIEVLHQQTEGPISWLNLSVRAGAAHDPIGKEGLSYLTAKMLMNGGSVLHSPIEMDQLFSNIGVVPTVHVDMEQVSFRLKYLQEDSDVALGLMTELLTQPAWDEEQFHRIKQETIEYLQTDVYGNDERVALVAWQNWLYEGHPYGHPLQGRAGVLDSITLQDVQRFFRAHYLRSGMVLGVASNQEQADQNVVHLRRMLTEASAANIYRGATPKKVPEVTSSQLLVIEKNTESTSIVLGHTTELTRSHPDWAAMMIAINALGAHRQSSGRLYRELRTERGLNYGDYAYLEAYRQAPGSKFLDSGVARIQNPFYIWLRPVSTDNGPFALRATLALLDEFIREGLSETEFTTVQQYLSGQVALWGKDGGRRLGWAVESALMGYSDPLQQLRLDLQAVTFAQVNAAIKEHLHTDRLKILVVTNNSSEFLNSIEEDSSLIVYDEQVVDPMSRQGREDATWSEYPVDVQFFQRSSKELFQ